MYCLCRSTSCQICLWPRSVAQMLDVTDPELKDLAEALLSIVLQTRAPAGLELAHLFPLLKAPAHFLTVGIVAFPRFRSLCI